MNHIALGDVDWAGKRTGEHNLASFQSRADIVKFVDEPSDARGGMAHDRRRNARLLDDSILRQSGADPADIDVHWADRPAADDDRAKGGVVGDRVGDRTRNFGSIVDDLERGDDVFGRPHHVVDTLAGPTEVFAHNEGQFDLKTRLTVQTGSKDPAGYDIVVNATPIGMNDGDPLPIDVEQIDAATFVGEAVMKQEMTPFLRAAQAKGCTIQIGVDMLFEQIPAYLEFFGFPTTTPDELRAVAKVGY
jgi:hypothetical protein